MIHVNYLAVLVCGIVAMVIGFLWYGPLFGKMWMRVVKATVANEAERKKMQKAAGPLYFIQFILSLFTAYVLSIFITTEAITMTGLSTSLWIWGAFVIPIVAGSAMWNNDPKNIAWTRFLIQAGYQLILFVVFALILTNWL